MEEQLETGLRGVPVGYCTTSKVDPELGLYYRGYPVSEMESWSPERAIYLLYHGKAPSPGELKSFQECLQKRAKVKPEVLRAIKKLPKEGHPMALFSCAILILGMFEMTGDYREDCLNLIAKISTIGAHVINHHGGFGRTARSKPSLGYIENFVHQLGCPKLKDLPEVMKLFHVLHLDHGGGNLSTFVGKAVASGLEDLFGSLAAAMNALAGPRHGRANQECLHFVESMIQEVGADATVGVVEQCIRKKLINKELIFGFGHAVLRVEDPRATIQYHYGAQHFPNHPLIKMALKLRQAGTKVLKENPKIANPYPNVDAISGSLLTAAGFPFPQYYTVLFGISRCVGIAIQIVYERCEAREGKGTPIIRPKYIYKGP